MSDTKAAWRVVANRLAFSTGNRSYTGGAARIYPVRLPQRPQFPAETYQTITVVREHAMDDDPGDVHARMQVDIYDETYKGTASGKKHVMEALSRFRGTATGIEVHGIYFSNERDAFIEEIEGADQTVWRRTIDFLVHFEE